MMSVEFVNSVRPGLWSSREGLWSVTRGLFLKVFNPVALAFFMIKLCAC